MKRTVYMDYNATTPVDSRVMKEMVRCFAETPGNPSSLHHVGRQAREKMEAARSQVAAAIGAEAEEIIFTSSGTESDNLAIFGALKAIVGARREEIIFAGGGADPPFRFAEGGKVCFEVVTSEIEHHAILNIVKWLAEGLGPVEVKYVPVDDTGCVRPEAVKNAMTDNTVLVSIMDANNETGRIQPIREIAAITTEAGVLLHSDAVQTFGKVPVDVNDLAVDLLTISAHKVYGPKGIGALYVRRGTKIARLLQGGHQEKDIRPGTENLAGIVGFGRACTIAVDEAFSSYDKMAHLREELVNGIQKIDGFFVNTDLRMGHSLPNTVNVGFSGVDADALLLQLDQAGICASTGAACDAGSPEPSHVLVAQGLGAEAASQSIRLSMGRPTTIDDVDYVVTELERIVNSLRLWAKRPQFGDVQL